jgi:hypothetical protein
MRKRSAIAAVATTVLTGALCAPWSPAGAITPCDWPAKLTLNSHHKYASGLVVDKYTAFVNSPKNFLDQTAKLIVTRPPLGSQPTLLATRIGNLATTGDQVKSQTPAAIAAINGDFFERYPIAGTTTSIARGPMIQGGRILRLSDKSDRIVGSTKSGLPESVTVALHGTLTHGTSTWPVRGVNWQSVKSGGVTVYTSDWSVTSKTPRPSGVVEWIVKNGKISSVLTGSGRGAPVAVGTRVIAFPSDLAPQAASALTGDPVSLSLSSRTRDGSHLATAMGRGITLVTGGQIAIDCYTYPRGARPRTTTAWMPNGRWALITIPGTGYDATSGLRIGGFGVTQEASIAKALGVEEAQALDGGGSVTLWVQNDVSQWKRLDDVDLTNKYERAIPNGLSFARP